MRLSRPSLLWIGLSLGLLVSLVLDAPVHAVVGSLRACAPAQTIGHTIRWIGEGQVQVASLLLLVAVGAFVSRRVRSAGGWGLAAFALSVLVAGTLKVLCHRPRPWTTAPEPHSLTAWLSHGSFQSFPSGETATTFAVAALLGYRFPSLRLPLLIIASCVGVARVIVGAHAPSDVWAGAMLGLAAGQVAEGWARKSAAARAASPAARARKSEASAPG